MKTSAGFSFIEVMIAVVVLAVGVIAAASLQTGALGASNRARVIQEVNDIARTELEARRQTKEVGTIPGTHSQTCRTTLPAGSSCSVTVVPCRIPIVPAGTQTTLSCAASTSLQPVVADQVTVRVVGRNSATVELSTVVSR